MYFKIVLDLLKEHPTARINMYSLSTRRNINNLI